jgi:hypothetical protein
MAPTMPAICHSLMSRYLNGFGREEGAAAPGTFGELLQSRFGGVIEAH